MYRVRCRWFANDFFAHFSKVRRLAQRFVLWVVEKHNAFILISVRVDHKDLARRTDEKWKRAPFRMLLYILWEVKCQVYSFWPHFKTPPTTFLACFCMSGVSHYFAEQNEQVQLSAHLRTFKVFSKTNTQRTTPNKNEQKCCFQRFFERDCSANKNGKTNSQRTAEST